MKNYKYHYVYRITNIITDMYYYGDRSCNCHPSEDIGIKYFSSSTLKLFIQDQKNNPQDYKYKIIKIFETKREDAKQLEVDLHEKFDVKNNPKFINRANQTSRGFSNHSVGYKWSEKSTARVKGITTYKDKAGNTFRVSNDDTRVLSGELICFNKGISYKDNLELIEKRREAFLGTKNPSAKTILIYDNMDNIIYSCNGSFENTCKTNRLPFTAFKNSYRTNGSKLYKDTHKGCAYTKLVNNGNIQFQNWYAKIENQC